MSNFFISMTPMPDKVISVMNGHIDENEHGGRSMSSEQPILRGHLVAGGGGYGTWLADQIKAIPQIVGSDSMRAAYQEFKAAYANTRQDELFFQGVIAYPVGSSAQPSQVGGGAGVIDALLDVEGVSESLRGRAVEDDGRHLLRAKINGRMMTEGLGASAVWLRLPRDFCQPSHLEGLASIICADFMPGTCWLRLTPEICSHVWAR